MQIKNCTRSSLNLTSSISVKEHPSAHRRQTPTVSSLSTSMDVKKSNKITDIVRLQQVLKKWKKLANTPKSSNKNTTTATSTTPTTNSGNSNNSGSKGMKFIKRTLSLTDVSSASLSSSSSSCGNEVVPKGSLAVCVGKELKRYVIPTEYLRHQAFGLLLREAEEEFGFEQEGVLKIPCEVSVFEKILKVVEEKRDANACVLNELGFNKEKEMIGCYSPDCELTPSHHPQMCR